MPLTINAKNTMLDALEPDSIQLHDGEPGAAADQNVIADASAAVSYAAAANGERDLADDVEVNVPTGATVSHYSIWEGSTLRSYDQFDTAPETYANAGVAVIDSAKVRLPDE